MADIAYIPIRQLHPHPDNPRKELGDLSELAASIKENGVYQNLTVIPGHYLGKQEYIARCIADGGDVSAAEAAWTPKAVWSSEDYTIIIGHRRAAAAQQAGKFELPCSVVDMTEKEQLQTMMVENMQRSDLTVYEQAQGFQMMLDMGDTVECVADRSGFSQSTIRRRIKLLELNHDNFKKAEQRGATLSDFVELNKIEDPTHTAAASGLYKTTVDEEGHVTATTPVTKDDITKLGIPAQDTTYDEATTAKAGLMSAADKTKLDGMGATINKAIADHTATDAEVSEMLAEVYGE